MKWNKYLKYASIESMKKGDLKRLVVYIEKDEDGVYVGSIPSLQSCYADGKTVNEMMNNLEQVAKLCLRNSKKNEIGTFVGIQNLDLSHA